MYSNIPLIILENPYCISIISRGRVGYGPSLSWAELVMGRVCMGRVCYGPSLSWAEFVMGRVVQLPLN